MMMMMMMMTIFKSETKNNTTLFLVELLAVKLAPFILRHPVQGFVHMCMVVMCW